MDPLTRFLCVICVCLLAMPRAAWADPIDLTAPRPHDARLSLPDDAVLLATFAPGSAEGPLDARATALDLDVLLAHLIGATSDAFVLDGLPGVGWGGSLANAIPSWGTMAAQGVSAGGNGLHAPAGPLAFSDGSSCEATCLCFPKELLLLLLLPGLFLIGGDDDPLPPTSPVVETRPVPEPSSAVLLLVALLVLARWRSATRQAAR